MQMQMLVTVLSALMAITATALVSANVFVIVFTIMHKRQIAMRFLSNFSRVVGLLRLGDSANPSRPYHHW